MRNNFVNSKEKIEKVKNKDKLWMSRMIYGLIEHEGVEVVICLVCIFLAFFKSNDFDNIFDITIFSTIFVSAIILLISNLCKRKLLSLLEDKVKLTGNYDELIKKYSKMENQFITYDNTCKKSLKKFSILHGRDIDDAKYIFPVVEDAYIFDKNIIIKHNNKKNFELPSLIQIMFSELLGVHNTGKNYNSEMLRVDNWYLCGNDFIVETSKTNYYYTLVTNRAIDFRMKNGLSLRELFESGKRISELKDSKMSNHLGINGIIETKDNCIILVKRTVFVAVGKSKYGVSVNSAVNFSEEFNNSQMGIDEIKQAIIGEIIAELKLDENNVFKSDLQIISAFRDIVEGGKPHLLFYIKLDMDSDVLTDQFKSKIKRKDLCEDLSVDGKKIYSIKIDDLKKACIAPDMMICEKKVYKMTPSSAASIVMFLNHINDVN